MNISTSGYEIGTAFVIECMVLVCIDWRELIGQIIKGRINGV